MIDINKLIVTTTAPVSESKFDEIFHALYQKIQVINSYEVTSQSSFMCYSYSELTLAEAQALADKLFHDLVKLSIMK